MRRLRARRRVLRGRRRPGCGRRRPRLAADAGVSMSTFWRTITVDYEVRGITAEQGADWHIPRATGTISFRGGQTYQEISVLALPDNRAEGDETLQITLTNPRGPATLANTTATGTIKNTN